MRFDLTPEAYLELNENEIKKRKEAFEAYKLQQEIQDARKWKLINRLGSNLGVVTIVVGIIASLVGLREEQEKNRAAIDAQTEQIKLQTQKQDEETKQTKNRKSSMTYFGERRTPKRHQFNEYL